MNKSAMWCKTLILAAVFLLLSGLPMNVMARSERGIELYNTGEFAKAEALFREALKNNAVDTQAAYYLSMSLLMQEKYQEALGILKKFSKTAPGEDVTPNEGQLKIAFTRVYLGLKNYPEALKSLEAAERAKADPVDIYTYRGAYYLGKNEPGKAIKELEKAIKLDSQNAYTYYNAGFAYLRLGHPSKAVRMFKTFLKLAPYAPEAEKIKFLVDSLC